MNRKAEYIDRAPIVEFRDRVFLIAMLGSILFFCVGIIVNAQKEPLPAGFRIGEKLTYSVSLERRQNVAYAELFTASRGKLGEKDAVEVRAKFKTLDFVSAAFFLVDETRTTFAAPESGLPIYSTRTENIGPLPTETATNFASIPSQNLDLLTLIYKVRYSAGAGSLILQDGEKVYTVTFQTAGTERVRTDAGEFETNIVSLQSDFLTDHGMKEMRLNISNDDARLPVLVRFRTGKGEFRAKLASVQVIEPETMPQPTPSPTLQVRVAPSPRPAATPEPYVENVPLAAELAFALGEKLTYSIKAGGQPIGTIAIQAKERKQFKGLDSLLLQATVTEAGAGGQFFGAGDVMRTQVDPETLIPQDLDIKFSGMLASLNRSVRFDKMGSAITPAGSRTIDAPVGTQNLLSLLYSVRSFNLRQSPDSTNPVNDTRVAVFWDSQPYIFTLRPSKAEILTVNGEKVSSQMISISTGNQQLDRLNLRIWLSNDGRRLPLKMTMGPYEADLISDK
ncbi:MAG: DUF3108 domain-containing protein [Acidobacteriota bacterium]